MQAIIGTQYYRPPFPRERDWAADMQQIKAAGLNTVQLWVVWAWVEPELDSFQFDDYDRLIELAAQHDLGVVLSTVAAIHPYWIHRHIPGSEMVTNQGLKVVSTNRRECHFGLTPGGCIDHPGVWQRMERFLSTVVTHFRDRSNLIAWDIWNELRWNVHADGLVCYCEHTIAEFRRWLRERYGELEQLNHSWQRRYRSWEDVQPGKRAGRTYTEMMAFEHFITDRSVAHGRRRYQIVKSLDPDRPATLHGGKPTVLYGTDAYDSEDQPSTALHRGNDWDFAAYADAVGCSSFPVWEKIDLFDLTARLDYVRSASPDERGIWLSELQGGMSAEGFVVQQPVRAAEQQRWVWTGLANRADTILFWSWRDELFGKEAGGFGLVGRDGHADQRIAALQQTRALLDTHRELITGFWPQEPEVGIWFSPQSYYLYWCQNNSATIPMEAIGGAARALLANSIPYRVVEETHLQGLNGLKLVFLPRAIVLDRRQEEALEQFVRAGGTLVVESEFGAYDSAGLYREPHDRWLYRASGIADRGRRTLERDHIELDGDALRSRAGTLQLPATQWLTPLEADGCWQSAVLDAGRIVVLGSYCFDAFYRMDVATHADTTAKRQRDDTLRFVRLLADLASVATPVSATLPDAPREDTIPLAHARTGTANGRQVIVCFCSDPAIGPVVELPARSTTAWFQDLISDTTYSSQAGAAGVQQVQLAVSSWGVYWLVEH